MHVSYRSDVPPVKENSLQKSRERFDRGQHSKSQETQKVQTFCTRCNSSSHSTDKCRNKDKTCHQCGLVGHIRSACTQRQRVQNVRYVSATNEQDEDCVDILEETMLTRQANINRISCMPQARNDNGSENAHFNVKEPTNIELKVNFGVGSVSCILDTGSDITVLKPSMIPAQFLDENIEKSTIKLHSAFGKVVTATLLNIPARLIEDRHVSKQDALLTCAVTNGLNRDKALLSLADYRALRSATKDFFPPDEVITGTKMPYKDPISLQNQDARVLETKLLNEVDKKAATSRVRHVPTREKAAKLGLDEIRNEEWLEYRRLQDNDASLKQRWDLLKAGKGNFLQRPGNLLMYHRENVGGFDIDQVVRLSELPGQQHEEVKQRRKRKKASILIVDIKANPSYMETVEFMDVVKGKKVKKKKHDKNIKAETGVDNADEKPIESEHCPGMAERIPEDVVDIMENLTRKQKKKLKQAKVTDGNEGGQESKTESVRSVACYTLVEDRDKLSGEAMESAHKRKHSKKSRKRKHLVVEDESEYSNQIKASDKINSKKHKQNLLDENCCKDSANKYISSHKSENGTKSESDSLSIDPKLTDKSSEKLKKQKTSNKSSEMTCNNGGVISASEIKEGDGQLKKKKRKRKELSDADGSLQRNVLSIELKGSRNDVLNIVSKTVDSVSLSLSDDKKKEKKCQIVSVEVDEVDAGQSDVCVVSSVLKHKKSKRKSRPNAIKG